MIADVLQGLGLLLLVVAVFLLAGLAWGLLAAGGAVLLVGVVLELAAGGKVQQLWRS